MAPVPYHTGQFPPSEFDWPQLIRLIGPASAAIARYDELLPKLLSGELRAPDAERIVGRAV